MLSHAPENTPGRTIAHCGLSRLSSLQQQIRDGLFTILHALDQPPRRRDFFRLGVRLEHLEDCLLDRHVADLHRLLGDRVASDVVASPRFVQVSGQFARRRVRGLAAMAERPVNETLFLYAVAEYSAFLDVVRAADLDGCRVDLARAYPEARRADCGGSNSRFSHSSGRIFIRYPNVFSLFRLLVVLLRSSWSDPFDKWWLIGAYIQWMPRRAMPCDAKAEELRAGVAEDLRHVAHTIDLGIRAPCTNDPSV